MMKKGMKKGLAFGLAVTFSLHSVTPTSMTVQADEEQGGTPIEVESGSLNLYDKTVAIAEGEELSSGLEVTTPDGETYDSKELLDGEWAVVDGEIIELDEALELLEEPMPVTGDEITEIEGTELEVAVGGFMIQGGVSGIDYSYAGTTLTILSEKELSIRTPSSTTNNIVIPVNVSANIIMNGVTMTNASTSPILLTPAADTNNTGARLHITLGDGTANSIQASSDNYAAIRAGDTTTLVIDDGTLNRDQKGDMITPVMGRIPYDVILENGTSLKKGERLTLMDSENPGTLYIKAGKKAAGIGGGNSENGGTLIFNGGIITCDPRDTSTTGFGPGIGGGNCADGGSIVINGGKITSTGQYHASGIGAGQNSGTAAQVTLVPAQSNAVKGQGRSGNITVNGGLTYTTSGTHGNALGDGCLLATTAGSTNSQVYNIIITGGTLIPINKATTGAAKPFYDLGGDRANLYVTGGSFYASSFSSVNSNVAYGDMDGDTKVFMTTIDLSSYGLDKVGTTLVEDMKMTIDGLDYEYGAPSYTDANGKLYFWLSDAKLGAEVGVALEVQNKVDKDELVDTEDFYATNVGMPGSSATLKQYISFEVEDYSIPEEYLNKRYDGLPLEEDVIKNKVAEMEIEAVNPEDKHIDDPDYITIATQLAKKVGDTYESVENSEIVEGFNANAGTYQMILTSSQYSEGEKFSEAFWGHRATYAPVVIEQATTEIWVDTAVVEEEEDVDTQEDVIATMLNILLEKGNIELDRVYNAGEAITLEAYVQASATEDVDEGTQVEAKTCASPQGAVQFYIDGEVYGDPVQLSEVEEKSLSGYNQSVATISWVGFQNGYYTDYDAIELSAQYVKSDTNYSNEPVALVSTFGLSAVNVDIDNDGEPDVNVDVDGDGIPDLNIDVDGDGIPDTNIDIDGDGIPDTNIDVDGDGDADTNIDVDGDGVPDTNIDTDNDGTPDTNMDTDNDGIPDTNIDTDGDGTPDLNIDVDGDGVPDLNIDTDGTGEWKPSSEGGNADGIWKPDTSVDTNGDGRGDYNSTKEPIDTDGDGVDDNWNPGVNVGDGDKGEFSYDTGHPDMTTEDDINKDTDGDGIPDLNIDRDGDGIPDVNVDVDGDGIPDLNIDTDGDGIPDVNLDTDGDGYPDLNIDTDFTGEWKLSSEGGNADGIWKPDTSVDLTGDGVGSYNSKVPAVDLDGDGVDDNWKPNWNVDGDVYYDTVHPDTNIDTDGDGIADLNIDLDGDGNPDLNVDLDGDGTPDMNIDVDGDGVPDLNIDTEGDWIPDVNVDSDGDGVPDINVDLDGDGIPDTNIDTNNDGIPDVNIDTDNDGIPDTNIDVDNDGIPDVNIDTNNDGKPDVNIDLDNDGIPDLNIDTDSTGTWKPSSDGGNNDGIWKPDTKVDIDGDGVGDYNSKYPAVDEDGDGVDDNWNPVIDVESEGYTTGHPDINKDTDGDGIPDLNVDVDGDGIPDLNIDIDGDGIPDLNIDTDGNGIIDSEEEKESASTGDDTNVMMYLLMAIMSFVGLLLTRRKMNR